MDSKFNWDIEANGMINHVFFSIMGILYVPMIILGEIYMIDRKPLKFKKSLFIWNMFLSIMSFVGAYHIIPWMFDFINQNGIINSVCDHKNVYSSKIAWYIAVFNATKMLEWVDTFFLIARKKELKFLHLFNHLCTYLYCWHATFYSFFADSTGLWFAAMNLSVHAVMYFYYALTCLGFRTKYSFLITYMQTIQMFIGLAVLFITPVCEDSWKNNTFGNLFAFFMYSVYFYLFSNLLKNKRKQN